MSRPRLSRAYQRPVKKPHIFKLNGLWRVRYVNRSDPAWIHQAKFGSFQKACWFSRYGLQGPV